MRTSIMSIVGLTIMVVAGLSAQAQSDRLLVANVPFNFYVDDKALPAGKYRVEAIQMAGCNALRIQGADGRVTVFVPTRLASAGPNQSGSGLTFNRFGEQYFLSQVFGLEEKAVHKLSRSRAEEALAKTRSTPKQKTVSLRTRMNTD
jgi:hypothetical protein